MVALKSAPEETELTQVSMSKTSRAAEALTMSGLSTRAMLPQRGNEVHYHRVPNYGGHKLEPGVLTLGNEDQDEKNE